MDQTPGGLPIDSLSQISGVMADSLPFPSPSQYIPPSYFTQPHGPGHMHIVAPPARQDPTTQRKRPKYTRSKTGCLTCRAKKIKCDESKPNCLRCTHGQRECTWPEGVPARKKPAPKREPIGETGLETRPSTAGSSGVSESSTPSTRGVTPPLKREPADVGLPVLVSRRHSEPSIQLPTMPHDMTAMRRQSVAIPSGSTHVYPANPASHTQILPAIPEVSTSYSASQYHNTYHNNPQQYAHSSASLVLPRLGSQQSHLHSMRSVVPPQSATHWSPPLLTEPDPLGPYFTSPQERNLIHHYLQNAMSFIMAVPSNKNPVAKANIDLILGRTRGADTGVEALRMAILGTAAVHQSFLCSRGLVQGGADDAMQLALMYRAKSNRLLSLACRSAEGATGDAALGAAVAICLVDIFSSGRDWFEPLDRAKKLVHSRGGPAVLLARSPRVPLSRLLLEIVAIYELFGCLVMAEVPTLLAPNVCNWWLERTSSADTQSHVEEGFGLSREFVPELARVVAFVARAVNMHSLGEESKDDVLPDADIANEARALYRSLGDWSPPRGVAPPRVGAGDRIYQNAAQILLLREILRAPPDDEVVQQHADMILTLCLSCGQSNMSVDLNWPVIIAGSQMFGSDRARVLAVFESFRKQCCYEIETAEYAVMQVWKRLDDKLPRADWRSVMEDNDLKHLIL
ncbi:hypothetical protein DAEQUDRAFT_724736 [Daedalea quercina L-15889]|uniref:Zn(2)-C6 fungal-type domain-containing protein n=1 Tax=Daedalea quercina L-15889 TaxID=1314783 RepID=A0A165RNT2_9APHY|nr:hypothetical protein DAEQUDRAFT_724736 [Daedalea quercina L-15889]